MLVHACKHSSRAFETYIHPYIYHRLGEDGIFSSVQVGTFLVVLVRADTKDSATHLNQNNSSSGWNSHCGPS